MNDKDIRMRVSWATGDIRRYQVISGNRSVEDASGWGGGPGQP
jgi:hypothetical protein